MTRAGNAKRAREGKTSRATEAMMNWEMRAKTLVIDGVPASVKVLSSAHARKILVTATGSKAAVEALRITEGADDATKQGNKSNVKRRGGVATITTRASQLRAALQLEILVPTNTNLEVKDFGGNLEVNSLQAEMTLRLKENGEAKVEHVSGNVDARGLHRSKIRIETCEGNVMIHAADKAGVYIQSGYIDQLDVMGRDSSDVVVGTTARNALLDMLGAGRIYVDRVTGRLDQHKPDDDQGVISIGRVR